MRTILLINPAAGKKSPVKTTLPRVQQFLQKKCIPYECVETKRPREATELVGTWGRSGEPVRVFGFGGDGTLNEIAQGAMGLANVEIGIFPCGSGNDYIRTFGTMDQFLSPELQFSGSALAVDLIYSGEAKAIGLSCMGLDATVAYNMTRFKRYPLVTGSMAYNMALVKTLCAKLGNDLTVVIDDVKTLTGSFIFALAGSGQYYGGGYRGAPRALPDDGLLDFVLVRTPKLHSVPALIGVYKRGEHICSPKFDGLLEYHRGLKMEITPSKPAMATFDGECRRVSKVFFEVIPHAVKFVVPKGCVPKAEP